MSPLPNKITFNSLLALPKWIYLSLLLLLVAVTYSNTIYSPFVLDDFHSFVDNPNVYAKDISFASLKQLSSTKFGKARLIPLISFAVDHKIGLGSIVQYHLTNITIHLLCTATIFFLIRGLLLATAGTVALKYFTVTGFALMATAMWALNPVQTNAVTYLVQRMTSIAALFYLSSLLFYTYGRLAASLWRKSFFFAAALVAAVLAFLSKENSFTLPVAVLLVESFFLSPRSVGNIIKTMKKRYWFLIVLLLLLTLPLVGSFLQSHLSGYHIRNFTLSERLLTEMRVVVFYLSLLLLPLPGRLNLEHDFPLSVSFFSPPTTLLALIFLVALVVLAVKTRRSFPLISFGIFWFFLNLLIESTFIPLEIIFEHRLYLSSVGFFMALTCLFDRAAALSATRYPSEDIKKMLACGVLFIIAVSSILTTYRNNDWRSDLAFHLDAVEKSPNKARPYNDYGLSLSRFGRNEEALVAFGKGLELDKPYGIESLQIVSNMMIVLSEMNRLEEAIAQGEQFIKSTPDIIDVKYMGNYLYNLGVLYLRNEQYEYAFEAFKSSLIVSDAANYAIEGMGKLLWKYYDDQDARAALGMHMDMLDKEAVVRLKLAEQMYEIRQYDKAMNYLYSRGQQASHSLYFEDMVSQVRTAIEQNSLRIKESDIDNHGSYKQNRPYRFYMKSADFIMRKYAPLNFMVPGLLEKADRLVPDDPFVALYLSRWFIGKGRIKQAQDILANGVKSHPDFVPLLSLQAKLYSQTGMNEEMTRVLKHILDIYPGHPKWNDYQTIIAPYGKKISPKAVM